MQELFIERSTEHFDFGSILSSANFKVLILKSSMKHSLLGTRCTSTHEINYSQFQDTTYWTQIKRASKFRHESIK